MAAASISLSHKSILTPSPILKAKTFLGVLPNSIKFPVCTSRAAAITSSRAISVVPRATSVDSGSTSEAGSTFHGLCYVVGDNIDTDQIIPAEYLTLVPSKPDEYEKLGSYALIGLPANYTTRFIDQNEMKTKYKIVIAGENFGCGSSREHAPVALGASGVATVVAESYARIFFRNSVATGEIYPLESEGRLCDECNTGDVYRDDSRPKLSVFLHRALNAGFIES
ncbi:hypothetical protein LWI28_003008 [Acer negundo]|uniref:Aconitase A/isopropylmalate dehydratase small subunit swivel domain-containing protein n=1 Tax=Acer negundo TaxID=4023 RepID=A0AAD5INW2_ACENE|nr:hypothetical protein LWI28_003008 [Acer negundo]